MADASLRRPIYEKYQIGTTVWSALAGGLLTGKYNNGIPEGSRYANQSSAVFYKEILNTMDEGEGRKRLDKVKELSDFAQKGERPSFSLPCPPSYMIVRY